MSLALNIPPEEESFSSSLSSKVVSQEALSKLSPGLREFYTNQNSLIQFYTQVDAVTQQELREGRVVGSEQGCPSPDRRVPDTPQPAAGGGGQGTAPQRGQAEAAGESAAANLAISCSTYANILLLIVKLIAASTSGSIAVIASTVDSVLDLISGAILWGSAKLAAHVDHHNFPVGKSRYEPVAILLFACLMGSASFQIITESCQVLTDAGRLPPTISYLTIGILAATVAIKAGLFLWCRVLLESSSCQALALDHFNDVVTNIGTLIAVLVSSAYPSVWFLDPAAAIFLALFMLIVWSGAAREQMLLLTSQSATPAQISRLVYIALSHEPTKVQFVDTVCAYNVGNRLQVECDVVLDEAMPLKQAHDVGENLQRRLEALEDVERAFVHLGKCA
jgi:cation diffusion facilitator family transporter